MEITTKLTHETLQNLKKVELENSPDLIGKQMLEGLKISAQNLMHLFEQHLSTYNDIFSPIDDTNLIIGVFKKYYFEIDLIEIEVKWGDKLVIPAAPILKATISLLRIKIMEIKADDKENIIFYINFLGDLIELLNFKILKEKDSKKTIATIPEDHARVINIDVLNKLGEPNSTDEENTKLIDSFEWEESEVINIAELNKLCESNSTNKENTELIDPSEHDIQDSIAQENKEIKKIKSPKIHIPKIKTSQYEETEEIRVGLFTRIKRALS